MNRQGRLLHLLVLAISLALAPVMPAQTPPAGGSVTPPPDLGQAFAKLQAGDAAGAAAMLEQLTATDPKNVRAWRLLGAAQIRAKNYEKAIGALSKSLEIEPGSATSLYNLGVAHALLGNADRAFEWLAKAKATRQLDMAQIETDADLAAMSKDPRFRALLPRPEDFRNPFVEPVKIIREWDGEAAGDQFGWIARNVGDVDGDTIPDVVTSAPTSKAGGENAGRVYVYSTKGGKLLWTADGKPGDQLGIGVEGAGDTNRDGIPDVIAAGPGGGIAHVYSGRDGRVLRTFKAENAQADNFGRHVSGAGDVNADGYMDVFVGAPGNNAGGAGAGRAYVYSGKDGAILHTFTGEKAGDALGSTVAGTSRGGRFFLIVGAPAAGEKHTGRTYVYDALSDKPKFVIESDETGAALGQMFVSVLGDVDADGTPDIYASDWANAAKGRSTGRIYVHSGKSGARLLTLTGETAGEGFGIGPATAGDVDGDRHDDLIVGSWQYAGAAGSGGRAYLYSGRDGKLVNTYTCRIPGDTFGFDAVGMGDVDRDGTTDFLITSAWSSIKGYRSGRMFIISSGVNKKR